MKLIGAAPDGACRAKTLVLLWYRADVFLPRAEARKRAAADLPAALFFAIIEPFRPYQSEKNGRSRRKAIYEIPLSKVGSTSTERLAPRPRLQKMKIKIDISHSA
jgi:hypothetical protein